MSLISEVNGFLDKIEYDFSNIEKDLVKDYIALKRNYDKLKDFRKEMDFYGFQNPYYVVKGIRDSWKDPFFRQTATRKKITFDRIQYSIAAHRISIAHFTEAVEVKIEKKRIIGEKALDAIMDMELAYSKNPDGVYNFKVIQNLPFKGEYMLLLSNLPKRERLTYRKIVGALGQRSSFDRSYLYRGPPKGKHITKAEQDLRIKKPKSKGNVAAEKSKHHKTRTELIVDKYVRKCLGIGYSSLGYNSLVKDLLKYYLKKSRYERERYTSIFPGIDPEPDKSLFGKFGKAIEKKEELDEKLESLKIHEKSSLIGALSFYLVSENKVETSEMFNIDFEKVEGVMERFKKLGLLEGKPLITKRTQKFLEYLKAEK